MRHHFFLGTSEFSSTQNKTFVLSEESSLQQWNSHFHFLNCISVAKIKGQCLDKCQTPRIQSPSKTVFGNKKKKKKMGVILNRLDTKINPEDWQKTNHAVFTSEIKRSFQIIYKTSDLMPYGWHLCNKQLELPFKIFLRPSENKHKKPKPKINNWLLQTVKYWTATLLYHLVKAHSLMPYITLYVQLHHL